MNLTKKRNPLSMARPVLRPWIWALPVTAAAALLTLPVHPAHAGDPEKKPDDAWISVSGTVVSALPDSFRLDYGDGVITVEMDDFDFYAEGKALLANDEVVVYGKIDDDMFEKRTIEASSVYVENLNTHFYASATDEEDFAPWTVRLPIVVGEVELTGTVISTEGREFTVDTGVNTLKVDTVDMGYNPMDDKGYLRIEPGDRVKVNGDLDTALFDDANVSADWIIELQD